MQFHALGDRECLCGHWRCKEHSRYRVECVGLVGPPQLGGVCRGTGREAFLVTIASSAITTITS